MAIETVQSMSAQCNPSGLSYSPTRNHKVYAACMPVVVKYVCVPTFVGFRKKWGCEEGEINKLYV